MTDTTKYEGWSILELLGHRRLGGYVTEVELAGTAVLRIDLPEHPWVDGCTCGTVDAQPTDPEQHTDECQLFRDPDDPRPLDVYATQFYSPSAMYCLTPTTEEMARAIRSRPTPVQTWELPRRELLAAPVEPEPEHYQRQEDDEWPL